MSAYFPSAVDGLPRGPYYPQLTGFPVSPMGAPDPFHDIGAQNSKIRLLNSLRDTKADLLRQMVGPGRFGLPQGGRAVGSFSRPFSATGNSPYLGTGLTGGVIRSADARQILQRNLEKRGAELEQMKLFASLDPTAPPGTLGPGMGPVTPAATQPVPLSKEGAEQVAFELLLQQLVDTSTTGVIDETSATGLSEAELRKSIGALRIFGLDLPLDKLMEYKSKLDLVNRNIMSEVSGDQARISAMESGEVGARGIAAVRRSFKQRVAKIISLIGTIDTMTYLVQLLISSINMSPRDRKTYVDSMFRDWAKTRPTVATLRQAVASIDNRGALVRAVDYLRNQAELQQQRADQVASDVMSQASAVVQQARAPPRRERRRQINPDVAAVDPDAPIELDIEALVQGREEPVFVPPPPRRRPQRRRRAPAVAEAVPESAAALPPRGSREARERQVTAPLEELRAQRGEGKRRGKGLGSKLASSGKFAQFRKDLKLF